MRTKPKLYCKCGSCFSDPHQLIEHIGLLNPHWPRTSLDDEHVKIDNPPVRRVSPQYDLFDNSLFVLPESYRHPVLTVLNPASWAETLLRKAKQDAADRAAASGIPTLDMI